MISPERGTKRCNRAAKSGVFKWLIFRRRRLIVDVIGLTRQVFDVFDYCDGRLQF
ncbi:hypothetical protein Poly51_49020 [Rubripirellula tenax]|uniref:Uncharacterized protein n=1 Tax=Rubripirellula tenax TaxID=2528015 RepID=A0A5C6EJL6_9BACT|nr:hypothetical protein Poly51_49020 [Rubripirellula tenax]